MKKILVIGANGLIGQSIVNHLCLTDCLVIELDYAFKGNTNDKRFFCDINNERQLKSVFQEIHLKHGIFNVIVNCAYPRGTGYGSNLEQVELENFNRNINLHLGGYFNVLQQGTKYFVQEKVLGKIISFGSIYGSVLPDFDNYKDVGFTSPVEYSAIKPGIKMLSSYFAKYYRELGLKYFTLSPGGLFDGQPVKFVKRYNAKAYTKGMLSPQDLFGLLDFLLSDGSGFMNGQDFIIDDGYTQ